MSVAIVEPIALRAPCFAIHLTPFLDGIHTHFDRAGLEGRRGGSTGGWGRRTDGSSRHGPQRCDDPVVSLPVQSFLAAKRHLEIPHCSERLVALARFEIVTVDRHSGRSAGGTLF